MQIHKVNIYTMRGLYEQLITKLKDSRRAANSERPPDKRGLDLITETRQKYENV